MKPDAGQVECLLGPDVPDAAKRMAVDPRDALGEAAGIEECIARIIDVEAGAVKAGAGTIAAAKGQLAWVLHWERVDLPAGERIACEGDLPGEALAFAAQSNGEVDSPGVFDEDVEAGIGLGEVNVKFVLIETAVEGSEKFTVGKDERIVVQLIENKIA